MSIKGYSPEEFRRTLDEVILGHKELWHLPTRNSLRIETDEEEYEKYIWWSFIDLTEVWSYPFEPISDKENYYPYTIVIYEDKFEIKRGYDNQSGDSSLFLIAKKPLDFI